MLAITTTMVAVPVGAIAVVSLGGIILADLVSRLKKGMDNRHRKNSKGELRNGKKV
jgi:hypothetical protein